jgi:hypothetical protein
MSARCKHCGMAESGHCVFEAAEMPPGCACDPLAWCDDLDIPPACDRAASEIDTQECMGCGHDRECHEGGIR